MLERVWRKGNPLTLLVGIQIDIATMENSMGIFKKSKTTMRYDLTSFRMAIIKESTKMLERVWRKGNPPKLLVEM